MNIKTIGTMFVLFSLISGVSMTQAYGDHSMASVSIPAGTSILDVKLLTNVLYHLMLQLTKAEK